jgi:hypothetical protein
MEAHVFLGTRKKHVKHSEIEPNKISIVKELDNVDPVWACIPLQGCQSTIHGIGA